jgi:hypothetical protein
MDTGVICAETAQQADSKPGREQPAGFLASQGRFARDPEAARKAGALGGAQKGRNTREKRKLRDAVDFLLNAPVDPGTTESETLARAAAILQSFGLERPTGADVVAVAQFEKASRGDTEAAKYLRDTAGQRPADLLRVSTGEVVDADTVGDLTDSELAELAAARDVALPVAPAAPAITGTVEAQGPEDPGGIC